MTDLGSVAAEGCRQLILGTTAAVRKAYRSLEATDALAIAVPAVGTVAAIKFIRICARVLFRGTAGALNWMAAVFSRVGLSTCVLEKLSHLLDSVNGATSAVQLYIMLISVSVAVVSVPVFRVYRNWTRTQRVRALNARARETDVVEDFLPPEVDPVSPTIEIPPDEVHDAVDSCVPSPIPVPACPELAGTPPPSPDGGESSHASCSSPELPSTSGQGRVAKKGKLTIVRRSASVSSGGNARASAPKVVWTRAQRQWAEMPQHMRVSSFQLWVARTIRSERGGPLFAFDEASNLIVRRRIRAIFLERNVRDTHVARMMEAVVALVFTPTAAELEATEAMEAQHVVSLPVIASWTWWLRSTAEQMLGMDLDLARRWRRLARPVF